MNLEIGTEAVQFPEKERIKGIFVAVQKSSIANISYLYLTKIALLKFSKFA
jgi:hypothetical protein